MKKLLLLLAFSAPLALAAQVSIAPVVGYNVSGYGFGRPVTGYNARPGVKTGIMMDIKRLGNINLQPGVFYVMNGFRSLTGSPSRETSYNINTLEIPINATFKTGCVGAGYFFFSIGAFLGINLSGTAAVPILDNAGGRLGDAVVPIKIGDDQGELRRTDIGLDAHAGYEMKNGLFARAYCQKGFTDLGGSSYSYNYGLGLGYFIHMSPRQTLHNNEKKPVGVKAR